MKQCMLSVLLLSIISSGSALPEACTSEAIFDVHALKAVYLTSYCIMETVVMEANLIPEEYGSGLDCSPQDLLVIAGEQEESQMFLVACFLQMSRKPDDILPLSPLVIKQRISLAADKFLSGITVQHECSRKKLEELSYTDAMERENEYGECMTYQTLKYLTHSEDLDISGF